jgi:hypothetical protein
LPILEEALEPAAVWPRLFASALKLALHKFTFLNAAIFEKKLARPLGH